MPRRKRPTLDDFKPEGILQNSLNQRRYSRRDIDVIVEPCDPGRLEEDIYVELPDWWSDELPSHRLLTIRKALEERLEIAAALLVRDQMWDSRPRPSDVKDRLQEIQRSAATLLKSLGLGVKHLSSPELIPYSIRSRLRVQAGLPSERGKERVENVVESIKVLHKWTERELWTLRMQPSTPLKYAGDKAFNALSYPLPLLKPRQSQISAWYPLPKDSVSS